MTAQVSAMNRQLRVAMVWNQTIQAEELLPLGGEVALGAGKGAFFPLPAETVQGQRLVLLEPKPGTSGHQLAVHPAMGGAVWISGERRSLRELQGKVPLGPTDYGVVTLGPQAFFFQYVRAAAPPPRVPVRGPLGLLLRLFPFEGPIAAAVGLSIFLHAAILVLFYLAQQEMPARDALELPPDLVRRFMVTPPPEDILEEANSGGTETEDPGLRQRDEAGGEAAAEEEGRVGNEDAQQEQTEMQGEINGGAAARVANMGLLGALRGSDGQANALAEALEGPNVSDLLGGLMSGRTVMGRGSGGRGLRGSGSGGGGTGPGTLFGAGSAGTGVGAGRGAGGGRGSGGPGAPGHGRGEIQVRMETARPRVSGYLSPEQILRVVRQNQAAIRYCYENELQRQPRLAGRVSVHWRIDRQGRVTTARIGTSTLRNGRVEGCMVRQIRRWHFPQPDGGEVDVDFPFIFGAGS